MRSGYWWAFAAIGTLTPFITLYYRQLGLSGPRIGLLAALPSLAVAFLAPVWGAVADRFGLHRLVLRASFLLTALTALGLSQVAEASTFGFILLLVGMLAFFAAPVAALVDSYGVSISKQHGKSYGSLRVWGSLGYTAAVWATGWWMGESVTSAFLVAYAGCLLLACFSTLGLPRMGEHPTGPIWGGISTVAGNRPMLVLLLTSFLTSSGAAVMYSFLSIHLENLGGSAELIGLAFALNAASELPVLFFGGWLLARLGSVRLLGLAILVYAIRLVALGALPGAEWVLVVQLLHGLSFGAFLMASVTLAHSLAGRERAATAQGLLNSMSFGFGSITGSLIGGALLDTIGTTGIFYGAAVVVLFALGVYALAARTFLLAGADRT